MLLGLVIVTNIPPSHFRSGRILYFNVYALFPKKKESRGLQRAEGIVDSGHLSTETEFALDSNPSPTMY